MIVLTLDHKEVKKFLKKIKHNKLYWKVIKKQGACYYLNKHGQKYYIEDLKYLRKILGGNS